MRLVKNKEQLIAMRDLPASRSQLLAKLAGTPSTTKSYERILGRLGMAVLQEQLPELLEHALGFQLLDRSDDGQFAAGFFIFDVNGMVIDCPVFLIDGKVKGYQTMFLRKQKLFLPAKPEIVRYLKSRNSQAMGSSAMGESAPRQNRADINFRLYSSGNRYLQKLSSSPEFKVTYPDHVDMWGRASGAFETLASIAGSPASEEVKQAALDYSALPAPDWLYLLENRQTADRVIGWAERFPKFSIKMAQLLGNGWSDRLQQFFVKRAAVLESLSGFQLSGDSCLKLGELPVQPKLVAFTSLDAFPDNQYREQAAQELIRYGAVFFDDRPGQLKTAMLIQEEEVWRSPFDSGVRTVAMADGTRRDLWVFIPKDLVSMGRGAGSAALVIDKDTTEMALVRYSELATFALEKEKALMAFEQPKGFAESLPLLSESSLSENDIVSLFDTIGNATTPFRILGEANNGAWEICEESPSVDHNGGAFASLRATKSTAPVRPAKLLVRGKPGGYVRTEQIGDDLVLVVPPDVKYFKYSQVEDTCCGSPLKRLETVPLSSLMFAELKKQAGLEVRELVQGVYSINGQSMFTRNAATYLMTAGLRKEAALSVLDAAGPETSYYAVVPEGVEFAPWQLAGTRKIAIDQGELQGDPDFQFSEPGSTADGQTDGFYRMPQQRSVSEQNQTTGMRYRQPETPPELSGYAEPGQFGGQSSGGSSAYGPPDPDRTAIFENSLFSSLIANGDPSTDRERLLAGLVKSCNDTGHSLFLTWAHGDEFANAYGMADADELEEQLLRVHEGAGKLMVMLFSRAMQAGEDLSLNTVLDS